MRKKIYVCILVLLPHSCVIKTSHKNAVLDPWESFGWNFIYFFLSLFIAIAEAEGLLRGSFLVEMFFANV
jgi:hypothetical protein